MKILLAVVGGLLVAMAAALGWLGAFSAVEVREQDLGPYAFVYVQDDGSDRSRVGALSEALGAHLDAAGFTQRQPARVRYPAGRGIQNQVGFMVERTVPLDVLGSDRFFRPIPRQRYMVARFPYRGALSWPVGAMRAEPALDRYRADKGYATTSVMVLREGDSILYLQPVTAGG